MKKILMLVLAGWLAGCSTSMLTDPESGPSRVLTPQEDAIVLAKYPDVRAKLDAWASSQANDPVIRRILEATGKSSILDLRDDTTYWVNSDGVVTEQKDRGLQPQQLGGTQHESVIYGSIGLYVAGKSSTKTICLRGAPYSGVNAIMIGPVNQQRTKGNTGTNQASVDIDVLDSGRGTYRINGTHRARCGTAEGLDYTNTSYYKAN
jgi:hypothetical protein